MIVYLFPLLFFQTYSHSTVEIFAPSSYSINQPSGWKKLDTGNKPEILLALKAKKSNTSFTVREFKSSGKSLKTSAQSWIRDYKSYGFNIDYSKPIKLDDQTYGFQIKALHKKSNKVFNQYMSINNDKLLILTCQAEQKNLDFENCGESLKSFSWKTTP